MKYLVVDDSPTFRRIIINALAALGFGKITEAKDGMEALDKMEIEQFDMIFTDWNMPLMNGLEFVQTIKTQDRFKNIPIIMVTTRGNKEDIIDALKARVDNYIVKPFTPSHLKEKIESTLSKVNKA